MGAVAANAVFLRPKSFLDVLRCGAVLSDEGERERSGWCWFCWGWGRGWSRSACASGSWWGWRWGRETLLIRVKCDAGGFACVEGLTKLFELGEVRIDDRGVALFEFLDEATIASVI